MSAAEAQTVRTDETQVGLKAVNVHVTHELPSPKKKRSESGHVTGKGASSWKGIGKKQLSKGAKVIEKLRQDGKLSGPRRQVSSFARAIEKRSESFTGQASKRADDLYIPSDEICRAFAIVERDHRVYELFIFLLNLALWYYWTMHIWDVHMQWMQNTAVRSELSGTSDYRVSFDEIGSYESYWRWLNMTFIPSVYQEEWYNGDNKMENQTGYITGFTRIKGQVMMRQFRVDSQSCQKRRFLSLGSRYDNKDQKTCYAEYRRRAMISISDPDATISSSPFGTMMNSSCANISNVSELDRPFCFQENPGNASIFGKVR